ncbi:Succinate dehydrogenase assembly factor 2 mitochondrial [Coemansia sp. RSA 2049]|nr:Succinate dehydrogenase assembly factor 2 mitochondrial [Coemansia sp. RSA 2049]KAJ2522898.1 Succinate dehydrogenase assembly factor 2 mitochondrial [Coemansia sp. RSA 1939]KAJ2618197.1 Succinate dehydrogenase assembly factor 2 mitochondrial [Coemansia sp. RSA 1804]KAJ2695324.1 Succinate dehydrogenase assembly factor 2 mitochondrial [Coemansia sp. RSA 1285]
MLLPRTRIHMLSRTLSRLTPTATPRLPACLSQRNNNSSSSSGGGGSGNGNGAIGGGLERNRPRGTEDISTTRRRLQYQMRKRGILETDLLLSTFASEHLHALTPSELADLDSLLGHIDWDIFYWATNKTAPPESVEKMEVFQKLRTHAAKRGSSIVRMPDLEDTSRGDK